MGVWVEHSNVRVTSTLFNRDELVRWVMWYREKVVSTGTYPHT